MTGLRRVFEFFDLMPYADPGEVCMYCGSTYGQHPWDELNLGPGEKPVLRILCSGERIRV